MKTLQNVTCDELQITTGTQTNTTSAANVTGPTEKVETYTLDGSAQDETTSITVEMKTYDKNFTIATETGAEGIQRDLYL